MMRSKVAAGVMALAATLGPGVASTAAVPTPTRTTDQTTGGPADEGGRIWIGDRTPRDHMAPALNADGIMVYPRKQRGWLFAQVLGSTLHRGQSLNAVELYLQTRGDRRPDYRVTHYLNRDGDGLEGTYLRRIPGWNAPGTLRSCAGLNATWQLHSGSRGVELEVPRRCIQRQGHVRINVETWDYTDYRADGTPRDGVSDAVPARRTLTPWI